MEKFTKLKPKSEDFTKNEDILFQNDHVKIINYEDWHIIKESDFVVCIPYLVESNQIIIRHEYIPTFKMVDGQEFHLTVLSGTIESGETPERALLRELEEEAGLVLDANYKIEFMKPLFVSKGHASKYHPCLLPLMEKDYQEVVAKGDGSATEKKSKSAKLDAKYLNSINASDLITEYMLIQIKNYLNMP